MAPFASELRSLMDAATAAGGKQFYLSAAPQCPYPDVADNDSKEPSPLQLPFFVA